MIFTALAFYVNLMSTKPDYNQGFSVPDFVYQSFISAGLSEEDAERAIRIVSCESRWNEMAVNKNRNGTSDKGLWQINDIHGVGDKCRFSIQCSTKWAVDKVLRDGNWNAWVCAKLVK